MTIVDKLNAAVNSGLKTQDLIAPLAKLSNEPLGGTPAAFTATIKADIERWSPIVKALGLDKP